MTKEQVKEILDRVLTWPAEDQERVMMFVQELEHSRAADDLTKKTNGKLLSGAPFDAIWRPTKKSSSCFPAIGAHEASLRAWRAF